MPVGVVSDVERTCERYLSITIKIILGKLAKYCQTEIKDSLSHITILHVSNTDD